MTQYLKSCWWMSVNNRLSVQKKPKTSLQWQKEASYPKSTGNCRSKKHSIRKYLHQRNIRCTIPHRKNEHHKGAFNKQIYRKRNIVERLINRLKQFSRIAIRYEKRASNFSAMITLASIFLFSDFAYRL